MLVLSFLYKIILHPLLSFVLFHLYCESASLYYFTSTREFHSIILNTYWSTTPTLVVVLYLSPHACAFNLRTYVLIISYFWADFRFWWLVNLFVLQFLIYMDWTFSLVRNILSDKMSNRSNKKAITNIYCGTLAFLKQ